MRLSIETFTLRERFGDKEALRMIKEAGFDAFDYSTYDTTERTDMLGDDYRERAQELRRYADKIGISCNQAHGPYGFTEDQEMSLDNSNFRRVVRAIEVADILGAKNIVIHTIMNNRARFPEFEECNRAYYHALLRHTENLSICISVENLFYIDETEQKYYPTYTSPEHHCAFTRSIGSERINACVDVGHVAFGGDDVPDYISRMDADLLGCLHIHDNEQDGVNDRHWIPYAGVIDWDGFCRELGQKGYEGDFTFEIITFLDQQPTGLLGAALQFAEKTGRFMMEKVAQNKKH